MQIDFMNVTSITSTPLTAQLSNVVNSFRTGVFTTNDRNELAISSETTDNDLFCNLLEYSCKWASPSPIEGYTLSARNGCIHLISSKNTDKDNKMDPNLLKALEKATEAYLLFMSVGWRESSQEVKQQVVEYREVFRCQERKTSDSVVYEKTYDLSNPHPLVHLLYRDILMDLPQCFDLEIPGTELGRKSLSHNKIFLYGTKSELDKFILTIRSGQIPVAKSLLDITLKYVAKRFDENDENLNTLPRELKERVNQVRIISSES